MKSKKLLFLLCMCLGVFGTGCAKKQEMPNESTKSPLDIATENARYYLEQTIDDDFKTFITAVGWAHIQTQIPYPQYDTVDISAYKDKIEPGLYNSMAVEKEVKLKKLAEEEQRKQELDAQPITETGEDLSGDAVLESLSAEEYEAYLEYQRQLFEGGYYDTETGDLNADTGEVAPVETMPSDELEYNLQRAKDYEVYKSTPELVYSAYYDNLSVLRYKALNGFNVTLHIIGNAKDGILEIKQITYSLGVE